MGVLLSVHVPQQYAEALDRWREAHSPNLTRGGALRKILAEFFDLPPPQIPCTASPSSAEQDERGEMLAELYCELQSYAAFAREVGLSPARVTQLIRRHERRAAMRR